MMINLVTGDWSQSSLSVAVPLYVLITMMYPHPPMAYYISRLARVSSQSVTLIIGINF